MSQTSQYLLRLEGVNLGHFVLDTNDLSTIRGGSLLLLHAPRRVADHFNGRLESISLGASSGLFRFNVPSGVEEAEQAQEVRREVESFLASGDLRHATFVVDVRKGSKHKNDREALLALNRWKQMRTPSLVLDFGPTTGEAGQTRGVCQIDLVRPTASSVQAPQGEGDSAGRLRVSASVKARRLYGQKQKQRFYCEEIGDGVARHFTHDFGELTHDENQALHNKMAVIYLDGNGFGELKKNLESGDEEAAFDRTVRDYRRSALKQLIESTDTEPGWKTLTRGQQCVRLETLLWGGDELIWVVPAWKGWRTLADFYALSANWTFNKERLTHAGGLVFCSHKAPIHRIRALAENLASLAKERSRSENLFAYQVLETFDDTGLSLERYRQQRWPGFVDLSKLILSGEAMNRIAENAPTIQESIPRRKLHHLVEAALSGEDSEDRSGKLGRGLKVVLEKESPPALQALADCFGAGIAGWMHLADLWDYLPEEEV